MKSFFKRQTCGRQQKFADNIFVLYPTLKSNRADAKKVCGHHQKKVADINLFLRTSKKFFDVRKIHRPVKILGEHDFWINKTRYNPFHDQLVLSTGSDEQVMLWRASSVSSAPVLDADSNETSRDARIQTHTNYDDAVYGCAWSACDAWTYATMSYDGTIAVNQVPASEKYKILL